jgi:hypothetical protein
MSRLVTNVSGASGTLVAKNPSTKEVWTYNGDARYVVTAMPVGL